MMVNQGIILVKFKFTGDMMSQPRVIGGIAKGTRLKTRKVKHLRPATDFVKEALFNILMLRVPNSRFLDLFAGSGSMGIEALSRGAAKACFVERDPLNARLIHENLKITRFSEQAEIYTSDVIRALYLMNQKKYQFDIIFVDPPFRQGLLVPTLERIWELDILADGGYVITRSAKGEKNHYTKQPFREERYGDSILHFFEDI
jgi:16S rRNA (guanine966-N2)-methyltransferase